VAYAIFLLVDGKLWRYIGQSDNGKTRITTQHQNVPYRNSHLTFLYFLWSRAESITFLLPVDDANLAAGPILNILEQWCSLIFRALQPKAMRSNFGIEALKWIRDDELQCGIGIREPLAQGFTFGDYPMINDGFKWSIQMLEKEFWDFRQQRRAEESERNLEEKKIELLDGNIFTGCFWNHSRWGLPTDYRFWVLNNSFEIGRSDVDRFEEESVRVHCQIVPDGHRHPMSVCRGMWSPARYNDPACRLGIKLSGIRKADQEEAFVWILKEGDSDSWIPRINRLVDWLENLDLAELRPRRWYPDKLGKAAGAFTRHPLDVGEAWSELLPFEELE
jgi:hypothetical protein